MSILDTIAKKEAAIESLPILHGQKIEKQFEFSKHRITMKTKVPPLEPVVKIGGSVFAVKGDLSFIAGPPKSGKTNVCAAMLASCFMDRLDDSGDLLNIDSEPAKEKPVIYIDTEQPKPYTQAMIKKILDLTGKEREPENLYVINMREFTPSDRRSFLEQIFRDFENEHLYFIDGITDFIASVNDETESSEFINFLMRKSSEKQIPIICVMHENIGSGKLRGHLGSEAERKCGGSIGIRKDREKQVHWIEAKLLRGTNDFDNVYFQWHPERKRFTLADEGVNTIMKNEKKKTAEEVKKEKTDRLFRDVYGGQKQLDKKAIIGRVVGIESCSTKTAERRLSDGIGMGIIKYDPENESYSLL